MSTCRARGKCDGSTPSPPSTSRRASRPPPDYAGAQFDRFLARVRRDAAREALDGLIAWHRENAQDAETPAPIRRGIAVMADEAQRYRDTHYPEETP